MTQLKLTVSVQEADLITAALGELPYKMVADLIMNLRVQAVPQLQEMRNAQQKPTEASSTIDNSQPSNQSQETEGAIRPEDGDERD